jgi:polyhydroxyalkanoate synthesis repressor PhaR
MEAERIIKKYPNRRLYDTTVSSYISLDDVRQLVVQGTSFRVLDAKTDEDITRSILLQIILEQESRGRPIFTNRILEQIIRSYGDATQDFMTTYLEQSMTVFLEQQNRLREQMTAMLQKGPLSAWEDVAKQNLNQWQSMQDSFANAMGFGSKPSDQK